MKCCSFFFSNAPLSIMNAKGSIRKKCLAIKTHYNHNSLCGMYLGKELGSRIKTFDLFEKVSLNNLTQDRYLQHLRFQFCFRWCRPKSAIPRSHCNPRHSRRHRSPKRFSKWIPQINKLLLFQNTIINIHSHVLPSHNLSNSDHGGSWNQPGVQLCRTYRTKKSL